MEERFKKLIEHGDKLFSDRKYLESFWQEAALAFYPEMASFTTKNSFNGDFADHLSTSYPIMARRALGDAFSALLRPVTLDTTSPGVWFSMRSNRDDPEDTEGLAWLEAATKVQRLAMYERSANFVRATKEGDHLFATFGQAPLSIQMNRYGTGLLYQCWHLRDVVWTENAEGVIDSVWRKWMPTARQLVDVFGDKVSPKVKLLLDKDPFHTVECRHIVIASDLYENRGTDGKRFRQPWVSIWVDVENQEAVSEVGSWNKIYVIPRWVTIPGSQYASSPAVTAALPDARLIQAMTLTLLEAGEKFADPPMIATQEAIRTDIQLFAGGVTGVDSEYDERLGEALRPLYQPNAGQGLNGAFELRSDIREMIAKAFFLDSLALPPAGQREMTAFEVNARISEWIRRAMPIFEPMEFEYNGQVCEATFDILLRNGGFGPLANIPDSLRGEDIQFKFESPIHESADRRKGQKFLEAKTALVQAAELDPSVVPLLNAQATLRDVLSSIVPAKWVRSKEEMAVIDEERAAKEEAAQLLGATAAGSEVAKNLGDAAKGFATAQATGQPAPG